jgi:hypothetical protein
MAMSLCTKVDYSNPLDSKGTAYKNWGDSAYADDNGDGIANFYDPTSTWYQNHKNEIFPQSTPVLTITGGDTVIIGHDDPNHVLSTLSQSASDPVYGNLTNSIVMTGTVFTSKCTTYTVVYSVTNPAQITAKKNQTVIVDCGAPEMTLLGDNPMMLAVGAVYTEPSATAFDNIDGTLTSRIVITGTVNTQQEGADTVTYTVSDRAGNKTVLKRAVTIYKPIVKDTIAPVITLKGNSPMTVVLHGVYSEPGATAADVPDGDISSKIVITGTVNTASTGTYFISYNVSDNAGNAAVTRVRTVIVNNTTTDSTPVITLLGKNPDTVKVVTGTYTDPGYSASNGPDGDLTASVKVTELYGKTLPINTAMVGSYVLVYSVTNKTGTKSTSATRYVYVVGVTIDVTPPIITLNGAAACTVMVNNPFIDPGVTATDDIDGIITSKVKAALTTAAGAAASMTTFTATAGSYKITYSVSDVAGNAATQKIRTIFVEDTTGFGTNLKVKYGVPLTTPLPSVANTTYKTITVDGKGPVMSTVSSFAFNWDLTNKGLYGFNFNYTGDPYYKSFNSITQNFSQPSPQFTISGTTISGLDGSYYIKADATQCVWVKTDGSFAIIFKP